MLNLIDLRTIRQAVIGMVYILRNSELRTSNEGLRIKLRLNSSTAQKAISSCK